ncbi:hypothetical protein [Hymenobacter guriensis]|uniref:Uncharacterized protein n=1 Tax=Hymenobacter guriensis TaxID=2793065 RepID=A0ABS0L419_9BACT|nr:hypothetical protein [Hymenobacter guriensis]MBG8554874.1 hypothetical protein [Hymenobacter guriensis]
MHTLYRFLLLLALLLISHFSSRAQGLAPASKVTITGFGDPEPASPPAWALAKLHESSSPPAEPASPPATPDTVMLPVKPEQKKQ